jgi:hypothetical protein
LSQIDTEPHFAGRLDKDTYRAEPRPDKIECKEAKNIGETRYADLYLLPEMLNLPKSESPVGQLQREIRDSRHQDGQPKL